jgi:hypothetical protein
MTKALDKGIRIREVVLLSKTGGKSGDYRRGASPKFLYNAERQRLQTEKSVPSAHLRFLLELNRQPASPQTSTPRTDATKS